MARHEPEARAAHPGWGSPIIFAPEAERCSEVTTMSAPGEQFFDVQCVLTEGHSETVTGPYDKPTRVERTPHVFAFETDAEDDL